MVAPPPGFHSACPTGLPKEKKMRCSEISAIGLLYFQKGHVWTKTQQERAPSKVAPNYSQFVNSCCQSKNKPERELMEHACMHSSRHIQAGSEKTDF